MAKPESKRIKAACFPGEARSSRYLQREFGLLVFPEDPADADASACICAAHLEPLHGLRQDRVGERCRTRTAEMDSGEVRSSCPGRSSSCSLCKIFGQNMIKVPGSHGKAAVAELCFNFGQRRTLPDKLNRVRVTEPVQVSALLEARA